MKSQVHCYTCCDTKPNQTTTPIYLWLDLNAKHHDSAINLLRGLHVCQRRTSLCACVMVLNCCSMSVISRLRAATVVSSCSRRSCSDLSCCDAIVSCCCSEIVFASNNYVRKVHGTTPLLYCRVHPHDSTAVFRPLHSTS